MPEPAGTIDYHDFQKPDGLTMYIVALNYKLAKEYATKKRLYPKNWRFVEKAEDLAGAEGALVYTTGYYYREDIQDVYLYAYQAHIKTNLRILGIDG